MLFAKGNTPQKLRSRQVCLSIFKSKISKTLILIHIYLTSPDKYTLYCQKYLLTHPNNQNQVFQSLPWPQVYKIKHLGMQTAFTNICERMGRSQELSEFQRGTVIGCHLCPKSSHEIYSLLNIPQSTVSCIIRIWKCLGTTATQPRSGRPRKLMEWVQQMLRRIVRRGYLLSAESTATDLQTSTAC